MTLTTEDYVEIQQLYARYAYGADIGSVNTFVSCFARDGEYVGFRAGGLPTAKGHEALHAQHLALVDPAVLGYHFNSPALIEATDYGAKGTCYLINVIANEDASLGEIRYALYYRDELIKEDGRWVFRRRNTTALPAGRTS